MIILLGAMLGFVIGSAYGFYLVFRDRDYIEARNSSPRTYSVSTTVPNPNFPKPGTQVKVDDSSQVYEVVDRGDTWVGVRKKGKTKGGRRFPRVAASPSKLMVVAPPSNLVANVFADWLDENGHEEAGAALRKTFPLTEAGR